MGINIILIFCDVTSNKIFYKEDRNALQMTLSYLSYKLDSLT